MRKHYTQVHDLQNDNEPASEFEKYAISDKSLTWVVRPIQRAVGRDLMGK